MLPPGGVSGGGGGVISTRLLIQSETNVSRLPKQVGERF